MKKLRLAIIGLFLFAGITAFGQVDMDKLEKDSKAITQQIKDKIDLTEDQETLVYRQVYTYEANMMKFSTVPKDQMNDKMTKAKSDMKDNYIEAVKNIVGEEKYAEIKNILEKKK